MSQPAFHVVIWGASGFTGRLVAEHLAKDYRGSQIRWALAGRSQEKLETIRSELAQRYGNDATIAATPILLGDLSDAASLDRICSQTRVLISTAGPFALHGTPIVHAALRQSTHYVDITGEVPWVAQLIRDFHDEAAKTNVRIVPCCGYDSTPSDLGALLVVDYIHRQLGKQAASVVSAVVDAQGGVSGGTIASGMNIISSQGKIKANKDDAMSPYALIPKNDTQTSGNDKDFWGTQYNMALGTWLAPFIMQVCNTRVVHRSSYLLNWGGPSFSYMEAFAVSSWAKANAMMFGTLAIGLAFSQQWLHPLLRHILPAPGEGPTRKAMMSGHWKHAVVGVTAVDEGGTAEYIFAEVGDPSRDPGYWGTSRMVLEAGLALALQQSELDADPSLLKGGVLTPASALGLVLIERLKVAGLTFQIKEVRKGIERKD